VAEGNKETKCDTEWGGYTSCGIPKLTNKEIINDVDFICDEEWNDNKHLKLNDSDKWEDIYKLLNDNKGLLLQASAGNGKTYTAKMIASKLGDQVKIIAPTNKAALNIGGSTIHRFLEIDKQGYIKANKIKFINQKYKYIIVDEISMIPKEIWKRLCLVKKQLPHIIFLLLGDEKQIPPVEEETIQDYFNHPAVKYLCNYNKNILNVRKRYDETLYNLLEEVDNINIYDKVAYPPLETTRNICYFNKTRIRVNKMWNDKLRDAGNLFIPKYNNENDEHAKQSQDMYIYNGLPVIAMRTKFDKEEGLLFANSETFEICDIGEDYISMYNERPDDNGNKELYVYNCPIEDFNKYFLMNYCSTTHKCQGETIVENFTIYDWNAMDTKLRYTALSRGKKVDQVCFN
jgi:ATP-dependent exoDNAse (exonuclease V) alpha subunit